MQFHLFTICKESFLVTSWPWPICLHRVFSETLNIKSCLKNPMYTPTCLKVGNLSPSTFPPRCTQNVLLQKVNGQKIGHVEKTRNCVEPKVSKINMKYPKNKKMTDTHPLCLVVFFCYNFQVFWLKFSIYVHCGLGYKPLDVQEVQVNNKFITFVA
jgi:hypothetical protein